MASEAPDWMSTTKRAGEEVSRMSASLAATAAEMLRCQTSEDRRACVEKAMREYEATRRAVEVILPERGNCEDIDCDEEAQMIQSQDASRPRSSSKASSGTTSSALGEPSAPRSQQSETSEPAPRQPTLLSLATITSLQPSSSRMLPPPPDHHPSLLIGHLPSEGQQICLAFHTDAAGSWSNRSSSRGCDTPQTNPQRPDGALSLCSAIDQQWTNTSQGGDSNAGPHSFSASLDASQIAQQPQQQRPNSLFNANGAQAQMSMQQQQQPMQQQPMQQQQQQQQPVQQQDAMQNQTPHPQAQQVLQLQEMLNLSQLPPNAQPPAVMQQSPQIQHQSTPAAPQQAILTMQHGQLVPAALNPQTLQGIQNAAGLMQNGQAFQASMGSSIAGIANGTMQGGQQNQVTMSAMPSMPNPMAMSTGQTRQMPMNLAGAQGMQSMQPMHQMQPSAPYASPPISAPVQPMQVMQTPYAPANGQMMQASLAPQTTQGMQNLQAYGATCMPMPASSFDAQSMGLAPTMGTHQAAGTPHMDARGIHIDAFQPMTEIFPQHQESNQSSNTGKFRIINPDTGEEVLGPSESDKNPKRLRIVDPGTGKEVLPEDKENVRW